MNTQIEMNFDGPAYEAEKDYERLSGQIRVVLEVLKQSSLSARWLTVEQIRRRCLLEHDEQFPEPSISAQIRNLRKSRFGSWNISGRYRKGVRIYEYKIEG